MDTASGWSSVSFGFTPPFGALTTLMAETALAFRGRQDIPSVLVTNSIHAARKSKAEAVIFIGEAPEQVPEHVHVSTIDSFPETLQHLLSIICG